MGLISKLLDKIDSPPRPEVKEGYPYVKCKIWDGSSFADAELKSTHLGLFDIDPGDGFWYFTIANDSRVYAIVNTEMKYLYNEPDDARDLQIINKSLIFLPPYYFVLGFAKQVPVVEEIPKGHGGFAQLQSLISEPDWGHSVLETRVTSLSHRQAKKAVRK